MSIPFHAGVGPSLRGLEPIPDLGDMGSGAVEGAAAGGTIGAAFGPSGAGAGAAIGAGVGAARESSWATGEADPAAGASGWDLVLDPARRGGLTLAQAYEYLFHDAGSLSWHNDLVGAESGRFYPIGASGQRYPGHAGWSAPPAGATNGFGPWEFWALPSWQAVGAPALRAWRVKMAPQVDPSNPDANPSYQYLRSDPNVDRAAMQSTRRASSASARESGTLRDAAAAAARDNAARKRSRTWIVLGLLGAGALGVYLVRKGAK